MTGQPGNDPAVYTPFDQGRYEVPGGMFPLRADHFGNGAVDAQRFQIDRQFDEYRQSKLAARKRLGRHVGQQRLTEDHAAVVAQFIGEQLVGDFPDWFAFQETAGGHLLSCGLTGEQLWFDRDWKLSQHNGQIGYQSSLDALACQIQEDIAIVRIDGDTNWVAYAHVCSPSGWKPDDVVGRSFRQIHQPVVQFRASATRHENAHVEKMKRDQSPVRFVWGIQTDLALNQYPVDPSQPLEFDPRTPDVWVRVERQTFKWFESHQAALFTIRVYRLSLAELVTLNLQQQLASALESIRDEMLPYKRLQNCRSALVDYLRQV